VVVLYVACLQGGPHNKLVFVCKRIINVFRQCLQLGAVVELKIHNKAVLHYMDMTIS